MSSNVQQWIEIELKMLVVKRVLGCLLPIIDHFYQYKVEVIDYTYVVAIFAIPNIILKTWNTLLALKPWSWSSVGVRSSVFLILLTRS